MMKFQRLFSSFRTNLVSGALALGPLAAVIWVVAWLWRFFRGVRDILPDSWDPAVVLGIESPLALSAINGLMTVAVLVLIILAIAIVGLVSRNIIGQRLLQAVHRFVYRIPVLRTVYSTLEQLLDTFGGNGPGKNFRRVVSMEYPRQGIYTLALVTGERQTHPATGAPGLFLNVFVPTTPNPTSGFFLTVPASDVVEVQLSVEEALKQIISMGMIH